MEPSLSLSSLRAFALSALHSSQILSRFTQLNDGLISVYMYGVKGTANRELIDVLTHGNRGESFIFDGDRWQAGEGIEGLSNRFRDPVLTDLRVVFATGVEAETYPRLLKNLYKGETVDFVGRVPQGQGEVAFSIKGLNGAKPYESFFRLNLAKAGFDPVVHCVSRMEAAAEVAAEVKALGGTGDVLRFEAELGDALESLSIIWP